MSNTFFDKYNVYADNVIVKVDSQESQSTGGIILPEQSQDIPARGTVLAHGEGMPRKKVRKNKSKFIPYDFEKGDTVFYPQGAGVEYVLDGRKVLFLKGDDILGKLDR